MSKKKFFNVIADASSYETAHIYLYGEIDDYEGKAEDIALELLSLQNTYGKIIVHVNSLGGEVYSGIAIVNALKNSKANIIIYIDGIAASMASVIALCGRPLYMSQYARLMLHNVKVGIYGDKEDLRITIEEVEGLENSLCEIIAGRIGKTPEEIKAMYFDGRDHWVTAREALAMRLIDGIYDVDAPIATDSTTEQIYKIFNNKLQNTDNMNIEEFRKRPSFVNAANDGDVLRIIDNLETEARKVPQLTEQVTALEGEVQAFRAKETAAVDAERTALLDAAIADERIKQPQRAHFDALLKADFANGKAVLESLPRKRRVVNMLGASGQLETESAWERRMSEIREKAKK
jgi:ATP-dependent Clp endopeptidase proteolytic subunit ClpP